MNRIDRRRILKFLLAGSAAYPMASNGFWFDSDEPKKQISRQSGLIRINDQVLTPKTIIKPGDTIETGENSEIVFTIGKDAHLLRSNTAMTLNDNNGIVDALRLISGAVLSVFGTGRKKIETPIATIGIRGTGTYFEIADNETYLCTCYGSTHIASNLDSSVTETLETTHHDSPRFIRNTTEGALIEEAPARNHSDVELIMLESTVGREPPFVDDPFADDNYVDF